MDLIDLNDGGWIARSSGEIAIPPKSATGRPSHGVFVASDTWAEFVEEVL
jgi:hypothetical protein